MTMKEIMKKVETYNEVAYVMGTDRIRLQYIDGCVSEYFETYTEFRKYIRREYIKQFADAILKADVFEMDKDNDLRWARDGYEKNNTIGTYLRAA